MVSFPSEDRWHRAPTPLLGGVAIAAGTVVAILAIGERSADQVVLIMAPLAALILGLVDDKVALSPTAKLVGSLVVGAAVVYLLSQSGSRVPSAPVVVLAVIWFAIVVHAVNLLDNMDGLAAGVGCISALAIALVLLDYGMRAQALPLLALAGALVGFLPWNL